MYEEHFSKNHGGRNIFNTVYVIICKQLSKVRHTHICAIDFRRNGWET